MGDRAAKDHLYDGFAAVAKALSNGRRAELVDVLAQGERHVEELASEIGQSVANTSQHLRVLAGAGLVSTRRDGTRVYYRLGSGRVGDLWAAVRAVAEAHSERLDELATAYLGDREELDEIGRDELARRLRDGDVVVVDVRPRPEFAAGHVAGAVSMPLDELESVLAGAGSGADRLGGKADVVAYCRGPYCVFADDAVRMLARRGWRALRMEGGYPEWREAGLPVATGAD